MLREVIKIFYAIRKFLGIVQYDSTTGLNVAGTVVPYESVTYSQFMDAGFDVATARFVHVSDKHSSRDASVTAGSLWRIDPAAGSTRKRILVSPPIYCSNEAAAPAAASHPGLEIFDAGLGPNGCYRYSDGTGYLVRAGSIVHRDTSRATALVCPASTFGTATVADSGGFVQLTGAGVHGLTQAVCVTAGTSYIWVTGGTAGLTVGFHQIRTVTDGGAVLLLQTAYASAGNVTCVKAGDGTDVVLETITLPRLSANSRVSTRITAHIPTAATNKNFKLKLGGTTLFQPTFNGIGVSNYGEFTFYNRGSVSSQVASTGNLSATGFGASSQACNTSSIDTSTGTAQITLSYSPATANEVCGFEAYEVEVS